MDYQETSLASALKGENNDCSVKALAIASGKHYDVVHAILKAEGRKDRKGAYMPQIMAAANKLGLKCYNITRQRKQWGTVRGIVSKLRGNRTYLVHTSRHILPVVNGKVEDWTDGRLNRVVTVWQIDKA